MKKQILLLLSICYLTVSFAQKEYFTLDKGKTKTYKLDQSFNNSLNKCKHIKSWNAKEGHQRIRSSGNQVHNINFNLPYFTKSSDFQLEMSFMYISYTTGDDFFDSAVGFHLDNEHYFVINANGKYSLENEERIIKEGYIQTSNNDEYRITARLQNEEWFLFLNKKYLTSYKINTTPDISIFIGGTTHICMNQLSVIELESINLPTLHAILVGDINDRDVGMGAKVTISKLEEEIEEIGRLTNLTTKVYKLTGAKFSKQHLKKTLADLDTGTEDVIWFYYVGHGFRFEDDLGKWPRLFLGNLVKDRSKIYDINFKLYDIFKEIESKGARLNLVFAEACNRPINISTYDSSSSNLDRVLSVTIPKKANYRKLFIESSGSILLSGASKNQYSWINDSGGDFFHKFLGSYSNAITSNYAPNWRSILGEAQKEVLKYSKKRKEENLEKDRVQEPKIQFYNLK